MPDICMCPGGNCPKKESCFRYLADPGLMQSYFLDPPIEEGKCQYYWKTEKTDKVKST